MKRRRAAAPLAALAAMPLAAVRQYVRLDTGGHRIMRSGRGGTGRNGDPPSNFPWFFQHIKQVLTHDEATMRHAIRYEGGFERNFAALRPGNTDFVGEDDRRYPAASWHRDADGLHFSFMEKQGKKFVVVRVQYGPTDIVLPHEVAIDQVTHLSGRHLGPEPLLLRDNEAGALLGDIIKANRERFTELSALRDQVRHGLGTHGQPGEGTKESRV